MNIDPEANAIELRKQRIASYLRILERVSFGIAIVGLLFRYMHWPYAGILITVGLSVLAISYFLMPQYWETTNITRMEHFGIKLLGWGMSVACIAILFEVMHWPMKGNGMLVVGAGGSIVGALITYFNRDKTEGEMMPSLFVRKGLVFGVFCL